MKRTISEALDFSGRMTRSGYWRLILLAALLHAAARIMTGVSLGEPVARMLVGSALQSLAILPTAGFLGLGGPVGAAVSLLVFVPLLAAGARRMRDAGLRPALYGGVVLVSVGLYLLWFAAVGRHGSSAPLVFAYGESWMIRLTQWLRPAQLALGLLCLWWMTRPSIPDNRGG